MENKRIDYNSEGEIDLRELFKTILEGKKIILRFVVVFGFIGLFIAVFSEKEYTASTIVVPQVTSKSIGGNLGGLAAMAGINLGEGNTENISPSLYPEIIESVPFKNELLNVPLRFTNLENKITYKEYYKKYKNKSIFSVIRRYTIGLPKMVVSFFRKKEDEIIGKTKDSILHVSNEDYMLFKQLDRQMKVYNNKGDGFIKISFAMPEALASAQMTKKVQELLQEIIIEYKTQKAKLEFQFVKDRYNELKNDFATKQRKLANFKDKNQGLITSRSQARLESIQSEYNLSYNVFIEMAKQLEAKRIKLKEDTPIFTVISPVSVPVLKSNTSGILIVLVFFFLGLFISICFIFFKIWYKDNVLQ